MSTSEWQFHSGGIYQGKYINADWRNTAIPQGQLYIGRTYELDVGNVFTGRVTSFNMWDTFLSDSMVALFAQNCRKERGKLFQWINLKDKVIGQLKVMEPSSCMYSVFF